MKENKISCGAFAVIKKPERIFFYDSDGKIVGIFATYDRAKKCIEAKELGFDKESLEIIGISCVED